MSAQRTQLSRFVLGSLRTGDGNQDDVLARRVARGSVAAFVVFVAGIGLTYCSQLIVARVIGADSYGVYAYVFAWMTVLAYVAALGLDTSLLRYVPMYQARGEWSFLRGIVRYAQRRVIAFGFAIGGIGTTFMAVRYPELPSELAHTFLLGFLLVPIWALLWVRGSVVRGLGFVVTALAPDRVVRDGVLILLVGLVGLWLQMNAPLAMVATLIGSAAGLAIAGAAMRRAQPAALGLVAPAYDGQTWRQSSFPLLLLSAAEAVVNRTGVVLLGWLGNTTDAGIYGVAFNIAALVALPRMALNALLAPVIADLFAQNKHAELQKLIVKTTPWAVCAAALIAVGISLLSESFLGLFGPQFKAGASMLRVLLLGQLAVALTGSQLLILTMTGHERGAAALFSAVAAANAFASLLAVVTVGPIGAAFATTAAQIGLNLLMALYIWQRLHLLPGVVALVGFRTFAAERTGTARVAFGLDPRGRFAVRKSESGTESRAASDPARAGLLQGRKP